MPITNREPITRRIDDDQWARISKAVAAAGCRVTDGTRLHLDGVLEMMETGRAWRDLDERFGDFRAIYKKMQEWGNGRNALFDVVTVMHDVGLTRTWRKSYAEQQSGPGAMPGLPVRKLMADLNNHCVGLAERAARQKGAKRGRGAGVTAAPKPPQADKRFAKDAARLRRKAYEQEVKIVLKAKGKSKAEGITDAQWRFICERLPELDAGPQNKSRTVTNELVRVMKSNMPWHVARTDSDSMIYHAVRKWLDDGLMPRIVRCLHDLKLTSSWSEYLISPVTENENRLKHLIGSIVYGIVARKPTVVARKKAAKSAAKPDTLATRKPGGKVAAKAGKGQAKAARNADAKRAGRKTAAKGGIVSAKKPRTTRATSKAKAAKTRAAGPVRLAKAAKAASKARAAA